ncbi:FAD binding domain-containing protein [Microbaculum marinisediminis]|uniref:Xanthine dehydrogenase family protein subunit M n=1 Tax=Microbaculum marinisediminis TaxID=2931392 RepID=A0AAW5R6I3_9HYPH|nr:xanthine dehydrogenase family protein subunit M [Microbaculum sp. A6E488]MCT8974697.1 xanthine dehydrogenase family protein subunit M [Microbaculum sp. A6E488]
MIPGAFDYHRPSTVAEALSLLAEAGEDGRVLAGGHSLIPMMKLRMAVPETLIDLRHIGELKGIDEADGTLTIRAMTTQAEVIDSGLLAEYCPILRETALQIADPQIRNLGTIGGNVANGDPGNDMPALMQALDAAYVLVGPNGSREVSARDFYEAAYFTALDAGEMLTAIRIEAPPKGHGYAYEKQKRKIGDYATAAAAVILTMSGGKCDSASIALTNVADTPLFAEAAGAALVGTELDAVAVNAAVAAAESICQPAEDGRGPADFRTRIAGQMVRRGIARAASRAR